MKINLILLLLILSSCSTYRNHTDNERITNVVKTALFEKPLKGPTLSFKQVAEKGPYKVHQIECSNLSPGEIYDLYTVKINGQISYGDSYEATDEQTLTSLDGSHSLSDHKMVLDGFMPGEPFTFVLLSQNSHDEAGLTVYPNPIQATGNDGTTISIRSLSSCMDSFALVGNKLDPGEAIRLLTTNWDEKMDIPCTAKEDGTLAAMILPMVKGKDGGITYLTIERLATGEKISLEFPYGSFAFKKTAGTL